MLKPDLRSALWEERVSILTPHQLSESGLRLSVTLSVCHQRATKLYPAPQAPGTPEAPEPGPERLSNLPKLAVNDGAGIITMSLTSKPKFLIIIMP